MLVNVLRDVQVILPIYALSISIRSCVDLTPYDTYEDAHVIRPLGQG